MTKVVNKLKQIQVFPADFDPVFKEVEEEIETKINEENKKETHSQTHSGIEEGEKETTKIKIKKKVQLTDEERLETKPHVLSTDGSLLDFAKSFTDKPNIKVTMLKDGIYWVLTHGKNKYLSIYGRK